MSGNRKRWGDMPHRRLATRLAPFCLALVSTLALFAGPATAAPPLLLWQSPEDGLTGSTAGRLGNPRSVAVDSSTGHLYVSENLNRRISEFTAWGEFVKAWGWGVATGAAKFETCGPGATPPTASCQAGLAGEGKGQFEELAGGIAVDGVGNLYVVDPENHRVQKFDSDGDFLLMFGGDVNQTKSAEIASTEAERNLCTAASGDVCGAGVTGTGQGEFSAWSNGTFIDVGPDETVYVGDKDRIQEFNPDGTFKGQIALPEPGLVYSLAVDPASSDLFMTFDQSLVGAPTKPFIYRHTSSGWEQFAEVGKPAGGEELKIFGFPRALAASPKGDLYVVAEQSQSGQLPWYEVVAFDPEGDCLVELCPGDRFAQPTDGTALVALAVSDACGMDEEALYLAHFVSTGKSYLEALSSPPDPALCPPPVSSPEIIDQFAASVEEDEASVRAKINSRFWTTTTYYVEYGTEPCSLGGCAKQPLPPGQPLNSKINAPALSEPIQLTGLAPKTTYHFRFVARTLFEPGPGGEAEVKGVGGTPDLDGSEGQFTTLPEEGGPEPECANAAFRTELSALLPDCRAYEMVSPVDKGGGDALMLHSVLMNLQVNQSSLDGNRMTYGTPRAFAEPEGAPFTSQYLATRTESGWASKSIVPPRGIRVVGVLEAEQSEYTAFTPDLCQGWLRHDSNHAPFAPGAIEGYSNLYSRTTCEEPPAYDAITGVESPITKPNLSPFTFIPELQGLSADGSCAVFKANGRLIPEASESPGIYQIYVDCGSGLQLVSVLPGGEASGVSSLVGTTQTLKPDNRSTSLDGAVSEDAERIYWSTGGKLYVREQAQEEQSAVAAGKCTEAAKACTFPVSETVSPNAASFWKATPTGSIALFTVNGTLQRFNFATKKSLQIAGEVQGVMGASEDLTRIYLVSKEDKDGGGKATAGQPNVYRYEGGNLSYVTTLSLLDLTVNSAIPSPLALRPFIHSARVTPDGKVLAFESRAQITGFDNREQTSGEPAAEVFVYSMDAGKVVCASCNRGEARPLGRNVGNVAEDAWSSALLPTWETMFLPGHPLSDDGTRLFFESYDRLVPRDTNGKLDVYQWETAGAGKCDEASSAFDPQAGGCVYLISTGTGDRNSVFLDASPSGDDVFIGTGSSLSIQDSGQVDVYDARVNGGFPVPPPAKVECEGQACQGAASPPPAVSQSATSTSGEGNFNAKHKPRLCPKGKRRVRGKGRTTCVKAHKRHRRHNHSGGSK